MANHFSALKRTRQTETRTTANRANKSRLRTALRELRSAMEEGDKAAAESKYREATSVLDKSVQKGVVHKNTASRYKKRVCRRVWQQSPASKPSPAWQTAGETCRFSFVPLWYMHQRLPRWLSLWFSGFFCPFLPPHLVDSQC